MIDGIQIAFVGDLKNGRTIRSLAYLLGKYKNIRIYFVSPQELKVGDDIKKYLKKHRVSYSETENLEDIISYIDVLYQTRIQKERFESEKEYKKFKGCYQLNSKLVDKMKTKSIIMHPLPRVDEISTEVDATPHARYFQQVWNGVVVRMALLALVLGAVK